jgi:alpha-beta hydrolase superfamily lysophospholipase
MLREALNALGIAFYAYDKRVAVPENRPHLNKVLLSDYVEDLQAVIRYFAADPRFSGIHLVGHSQGVLVGTLAMPSGLRSFTGIAGAAYPVDSVLIRQLEAQAPNLAAEARPILASLKAGDSLDLSGAMPMVSLILAPQNRPLLREWMQYDPTEEFKKIKVPALLIYGGMDTQVQPEAGWRLYREQPSSRLLVLPEMNHVLKQVTDPVLNQQAYTDPVVPLANGLAEALAAFILANH